MTLRKFALATVAVSLPIGSIAACAEAEPRNAPASARAPAPKDVRSSGGYRIEGTPVAFVEPGRTSQGEAFFDSSLLLRFNRALPKDGGLVEASIFVNGATGTSPPVGIGARSRHCYAQFPEFSAASAPRTGDKGTLMVRIPRVKRALRLPIVFRNRQDTKRVYEKLACGKGATDDPD